MNKNLKIKISGVRTLAQARFLSSFSVDLIGFCFDQSNDSYIAPLDAQEIMKWLEGPEMVGEFGNQTANEVNEIALIMGLKIIQAPYGFEAKKALDASLHKIYAASIDEIFPDDRTEVLLQLPNNAEESTLTKANNISRAHNTLLDISCLEDWRSVVDRVEPIGINFSIRTGRDEFETFEVLKTLFESVENEL